MKNKGLIVVIIILVLGLCATTGYIVYDKVMVKSSTDSQEKKSGGSTSSKLEVKELSEKEAETFIRKINKLNARFYKQYPIDDVSKITNDDALEFGEFLVTNGIYTQSGVTGFSGSKLKEEIISYFGSDYPLKLESVKCFAGDGVWYQYDASTDHYTKVGNHGHGGPGSGRSQAFFQDGTYDQNTETYVIHAKVLSSDSAGELSGPRVDFYDAFNFDSKVYNTQEDTDYDVVYKEVSDKLSVITYTFAKNSDGGYGFKSVTLK